MQASFLAFMLLSKHSVVHGQILKSDAPVSIESQIIEATKEQLTGNPDKAIEMFEKLRSEPEARSTVYYQLSRLYLSKSRLEDAINAISESVKADPTNKWTRVFQANLLESVGRYFGTAEAYEGLSQILPDQYSFYDLAALNYVKANQDEKALAVLDKAQNKFGLLPALVIKKSRILVHLGREKKAIDLITSSLRSYPVHEELLSALYDIYIAQANKKEAEKILLQLKTIDPLYTAGGKISQPAPNVGNPESIEQQIREGKTGLDEIIRSLIPFIEQNRSTDSARLKSIADLLIQKYPQEAKAWALRGDLSYYTEDLTEAVSDYEKSATLQNVPYSVWENMIVCLLNLSHWKKLEEKISQALDFYPNQPFLYFALAESQLQLSNTGEALTNAQHFKLMSKNNPFRQTEANLLLARIYSATGNFQQADLMWTECLNSEKNEAAVLENAVYQSARGQIVNKAKIEEIYNNKNLFKPFVLNRLAIIASNQNDWDLARKRIEECLQLKTGRNSDNYALAAKICLAQQQKENAIIYAQKAVDLSDDRNRYLQLLNKMK